MKFRSILMIIFSDRVTKEKVRWSKREPDRERERGKETAKEGERYREKVCVCVI